MSPNIFEINEDKINEINVVNFFSCFVQETFVGLVNILQEHWILGVTGPTGPVTYRVSVDRCVMRVDVSDVTLIMIIPARSLWYEQHLGGFRTSECDFPVMPLIDARIL